MRRPSLGSSEPVGGREQKVKANRRLADYHSLSAGVLSVPCLQAGMGPLDALSAQATMQAQNTEAHRQHQNGEKGYGRVSERRYRRLVGLCLQTVGPLETPSAPAMAQSLRILERMGALNSQHDIVMDYKVCLPACSQFSWLRRLCATLHTVHAGDAASLRKRFICKQTALSNTVSAQRSGSCRCSLRTVCRVCAACPRC